MKKSLLVISIISIATFLLLFGAVASAETKIGIVDLNKVLADSSRLADTEQSLKKKFESRKKEITNAQEKMQKVAEAFNKKASTMDAEKKKVERKKISEERQKLQKMRMKFQKEFREAQNKAREDIRQEVKNAISEIAANKSLDLVFTKSALAYNKQELSITEEVVEKLKKAKVKGKIEGKKRSIEN